MSHFYMAHGDADELVASAFRRKLQNEGHKVVAIDEGAVPDADWKRETIRAIADATSLIVFASHDELRSDPQLQYQLGVASALGKKAIQFAPADPEPGRNEHSDPAIQVYYYDAGEIAQLDPARLRLADARSLDATKGRR